MMDSLYNSIAEPFNTAMQYIHWIAGLALLIAAIFTGLLMSGFFVPRVKNTVAVITKVFAGAVLLLVLGGAGLIYYLTPSTRVVSVPTPVVSLPDVKFPEFPELPDMPDIPIDEILESASNALDALTEMSTSALAEAGQALTPAEPSAEMIARRQQAQREALRNRQLQMQINHAHHQLLQASQQFGVRGGYFAGGTLAGSLGPWTWENRYRTSRGRSARSRGWQLERQLDEAVDRVTDQFMEIENNLFFSLSDMDGGPADFSTEFIRPAVAARSIGNRVRVCKDKAWKYAAKRRKQLHKIDVDTIHDKVARWRSQGMQKELRQLADDLRSEWAAAINSKLSVTLN